MKAREEKVQQIHFFFFRLVPSFSPYSVICFSLSLSDLCGHWWGLTGACSNTIPVAHGEEWPPFPLRSLSFPTGRPACLCCLISRDIQTVERDVAQCTRMKVAAENEARGALDIFHSYTLRTCAEQKSDYKSAGTGAKKRSVQC